MLLPTYFRKPKMRVINPNANVGKLVAYTINGKPEKFDVKIIRFLQSAIFVFDALVFRIEISLFEKTGTILSENIQVVLEEISYKILRDSESTIFKIEWKITSDELIVNRGNYYSLILFDSGDDLDFILKITNLDVQEFN